VIRRENLVPGGELKGHELESQFSEQIEENRDEQVKTIIRAIGQAGSRETLNLIWQNNLEFTELPEVNEAFRKAAAKYPKQLKK